MEVGTGVGDVVGTGAFQRGSLDWLWDCTDWRFLPSCRIAQTMERSASTMPSRPLQLQCLRSSPESPVGCGVVVRSRSPSRLLQALQLLTRGACSPVRGTLVPSVHRGTTSGFIVDAAAFWRESRLSATRNELIVLDLVTHLGIWAVLGSALPAGDTGLPPGLPCLCLCRGMGGRRLISPPPPPASRAEAR